MDGFFLTFFLKAGTKVSPNTKVPSVKILAVMVNLHIFKEVQMLCSFLRCFPNIEILHLEVTIRVAIHLLGIFHRCYHGSSVILLSTNICSLL